MIAKIIFIFFVGTGVMERKLVLESCLTSGRWGLLEMWILLTDDIVEFDGGRRKYGNLEAFWKKVTPAIDIKLDYREHHDLFLLLLTVKCPVSSNIGNKVH